MKRIQTVRSTNFLAIALLSLTIFFISSCTVDEVEPDPKVEEPVSLQVGLIGHWNFDADIEDASPLSAIMESLRDPTFTNDRRKTSNRAMDFNTGNMVYSRGGTFDFSDIRPYSVAAWVKADGNGTIVSKENGSVNPVWGLSVVDGKYVAFRKVYPFRVTSVSEAIVGEWQHVAMVYDGITLKLYVNGVMEGSEEIGSVGVDRYRSAMHIGGLWGPWGPKSGFNGLLDDVRWYERPLLDQEVQWLADN